MATLVVSSDIGERESTGWEGWDQGLISERRSAERISTKEVSGSDSILTYFSCVERADDAREISRSAGKNADLRDDAFLKTAEISAAPSRAECADDARDIPRPAGENADLRDEAFSEDFSRDDAFQKTSE